LAITGAAVLGRGYAVQNVLGSLFLDEVSMEKEAEASVSEVQKEAIRRPVHTLCERSFISRSGVYAYCDLGVPGPRSTDSSAS
jgi:hypothetical protein